MSATIRCRNPARGQVLLPDARGVNYPKVAPSSSYDCNRDSPILYGAGAPLLSVEFDAPRKLISLDTLPAMESPPGIAALFVIRFDIRAG